MSLTLSFDEPAAADQSLVGGKGVNLARLSQAGFLVPEGFVVTTDAYAAAIEGGALGGPISQRLASIDYTDFTGLEAATARIRELIEQAPVPAEVEAEVRSAYDKFGQDTYVAVRSSGTAEDLAETSFAGQHDTYLDIHGADAVIDAVRRCWASMWSARATAYRQQQGIDHADVRLAVVVQRMVDSEVSGVMFTGNPVTSATDEIVINASYGLGEGIVSGILEPDQFVLAHHGLRLKNALVGSKEKQVVRNPDTGIGVIETDTPAADRTRRSLDDAQLRALGKLGRAVQRHYGGIPQDIEWALAGGELHLLQSRDITGARFSWDEELEVPFTVAPEAPDDTVWTRAWSDSVWPGAVTPLFYSIRIQMIVGMSTAAQSLWGAPEVAALRPFRYHRARTYYNTHVDAGNIARFWPPALRDPALMAMVPPVEHERLKNGQWSWTEIPKVLARVRMLDPDHGPLRTWRVNYAAMDDARAGLGLGPDEVAELDDDELKAYLDSRILAQKEWIEDIWTPFFLYMPIIMGSLMKMVGNWYRGTNPMIFSDLITGLPEHTITLKENVRLWDLTQLIAGDTELRAAFDAHPGAAFFENLPDTETGREFAQRYAVFVEEFGHRGHAERDMVYARRAEDPTIDYRNFQSLLSAGGQAPDANMDALIARRKQAEEEMAEGIRAQPFGGLKLEAFRMAHDWILRFFVFRDDERHHTDRITMSKKWPTLEIARRLTERGVIEGDEFWFLSIKELYKLLDGAPRTRLHDAMIAGRRANYDAVDKEGFVPSMYLQGYQYPQLDTPAAEVEAVDGVYPGLGTSRGQVTGRARVIATQADIGRVQKGDILITHATDPGWTPVFMVLSGLVLETGGMLCHGSCISREYGIPAVQLAGAMTHIPDGATITIDGDLGTVTLVEVPEPAAAGT
ncbi:MAG TPA: PEP/pyruvate-binding domain-containing protein [Pseudonocardia sp.]|jgi:pyruvate,water dikinase|nr:PEP/pyruvate-binding domain-containing protein [Pseudonocardia sp.]